MVVEEEADVDLICSWVRCRGDGGRRVGKELESHGRSIIRHAHEIRVGSRQVRETEERGEGSVRAELDSDLGFAFRRDGVVEELDDLARESLARDGAHGVGGVVGEVPFVGVGEGAEAEEGFVGEEVGAVDCGVVDFGDVDEVEDCEERRRC